MDGQSGGWTDRWMDGWVGRWTDRWMRGWVDGPVVDVQLVGGWMDR